MSWNKLFLTQFLLNLAGYCNILLDRNFAAEIVATFFLVSIAIRNASVQATPHSSIWRYTVLSPLKFPGPKCAISSFSKYIVYAKYSFHLRKSQRERPAVVTRDCVYQSSKPVGFTRITSRMDWILLFLVARASCFFASSEGYMCYCHWAAKQPMSAFLSLLCIKMF